MTENYKFNPHRTCEYFPCHRGVAQEDFNCLFCYCPLYHLGEECGGNYSYHEGLKDCSPCTKPHDANSYDFVMSKMDLIFRRKD